MTHFGWRHALDTREKLRHELASALDDPVGVRAVEHDPAIAVFQQQPDIAAHVHCLLHLVSPPTGHWNPKLPSKTE